MTLKKLFCYVDETGQDTLGKLFVVSVVIASQHRDQLRETLERIEHSSGKGQVKWRRAKRGARESYARSVLSLQALTGAIFFDSYPNTANYPIKTVSTVARAVARFGARGAKATIFVDGLRRSEYQWFGVELRHLGVKVAKVRGVRREEADALMRLTDAVCGIVRAAILGEATYAGLLASARAAGIVRPLIP
jgi:hypothetical protein